MPLNFLRNKLGGSLSLGLRKNNVPLNRAQQFHASKVQEHGRHTGVTTSIRRVTQVGSQVSIGGEEEDKTTSIGRVGMHSSGSALRDVHAKRSIHDTGFVDDAREARRFQYVRSLVRKRKNVEHAVEELRGSLDQKHGSYFADIMKYHLESAQKSGGFDGKTRMAIRSRIAEDARHGKLDPGAVKDLHNIVDKLPEV